MADQISLIAKLLANENINVMKANISTAAFDIKNRTLVLPQWNDMTDEIEQMLVAHEIGHALWTNELYYQAIDNKVLDFPHAKEYLNIFEDIRVERLCKIRYPGIRKTFREGYKQLADRDFFGTKGKSLEVMSFPDRVNLYYKLGTTIQIPFSTEEKRFVNRAEKTETIQDVISLVQDVYDFCKSSGVESIFDILKSFDDVDAGDESSPDGLSSNITEQNYSKLDSFDEKCDIDSDTIDSEIVDNNGQSNDELNDESYNNDNSTGFVNSPLDDENDSNINDFSSENDDEDEIAAPFTNKIFEQKLQQLANHNINYRYWHILPFEYNPIISYQNVLKYITKVTSCYNYCRNDGVFINRFKNETNNNVSYLVKEFEMKKAATEYKRTHVAKTGVLDTNKLWSYKISDDLFKQIQVVKSGKNHGMIFLLDWSGSMTDVIDNTLKQLINLVMFCRRIQIPFQVFAFADTCTSEDAKTWKKAAEYKASETCHNHNNIVDLNWEKLALIELFSHTMSTSDFNKMIDHIIMRRFRFAYSMSGTPLNSTLAFMYDYIDKFQTTFRVEKLSLITLTDGVSAPFRHMFSDTKSYWIDKNFVINNNKNYPFSLLDGLDQTSTMLKMIKDRYQCTMVGFFLTKHNRHDLVYAVRSIYPNIELLELYSVIDRIRSNFKSHGVHTIVDNAYDELYLIRSDHMKIDSTELNITKNLSAAGIATQFGKHLKFQKTSRVLLQKFIEQIA